jgi:c-di-GMP-binding flagellar brake protein YcgR
VTVSSQSAPHLVRRQAWTEAHLVEGTDALLWPATDENAASADELPDPGEAVRAILSWVRPKVLRFKMTAPPRALPELVLVSTRAVSGPARFVAHKSYQISTTVVCEPPNEVHIVERRDLFRVPVATRVTVSAPSGQWALYSMDCSLGGMRVCPPELLEVGAQVDLTVELSPGQVLVIPAVVRHSQPYAGAGGGSAARPDRDCDGCPSQVGLQFLPLPAPAERHLAQFVAYHQRRLMPRVKTLLTVQYRCERRRQFVEALVNEVSPGDIVLVAHEEHLPGDRLELRLRLGSRDYNFEAHAVSCQTVEVGRDNSPRHLVKASLDDGGDVAETRYRIAVRDLALEQLGSSARAAS